MRPVAPYLQRPIALVLVLVGCWGAFLIFYGVVASMTGEFWKPLEQYAPTISSGLTILGAIFVATSVYLPAESHPPYRVSRQAVAPVVIICGVLAFGFLCVRGALPDVLVTGFSLLAISGSMLRFYDIDPKGGSN